MWRATAECFFYFSSVFNSVRYLIWLKRQKIGVTVILDVSFPSLFKNVFVISCVNCDIFIYSTYLVISNSFAALQRPSSAGGGGAAAQVSDSYQCHMHYISTVCVFSPVIDVVNAVCATALWTLSIEMSKWPYTSLKVDVSGASW